MLQVFQEHWRIEYGLERQQKHSRKVCIYISYIDWQSILITRRVLYGDQRTRKVGIREPLDELLDRGSSNLWYSSLVVRVAHEANLVVVLRELP